MKKYGILLFLLVLVTLLDFSKDNAPKFGIKAKSTESGECKLLCEKASLCLTEEQKKSQDPKMYQFACEILCTKQYQLFSECSKAIADSCTSGELCIKNQTKGLF
ncbi:hypothetical protein [Leptospira kanakyensis]|uniref:Cys-rich protein n=1 Tax=Leptospira kanakyensis TaxID=2484968 RepID=A0A6N4PUK0_9LEPT|nr:hypothetical protein [Leptospira kanakyensis]MCW7467922.1 hypothetical protein [Leptospira kanakyensis]MCW7482543.1 hypothetical protein [Leptospira kanakyensis]TGK49430.1 hypothetical protein EHQ11_15525 [Leptospira kanakyensis]TGK60330.1 hypothetical protein EHQ16_09665 [Leptospira kanakyensis]TGK67729.1 hypothetical protein EHQ18_14465 [Leptospira kanakyensis]